MQVGDVCIPVGNYQLACGSGLYTHAICVSVTPLVLVSEQGDMLWRATVTHENVRPLCQAAADIVAVAMKRFKSGR